MAGHGSSTNRRTHTSSKEVCATTLDRSSHIFKLASRQRGPRPGSSTIMEVTSLNFESAFPDIISAYLRCSFVTIDCEFSGVRVFEKDDTPVRTSLRGRAGSALSSADGDASEWKMEGNEKSLLKEEAYRRLRSAAQKYTVLQLGLTFAWPDGKRIVSYSVVVPWRADSWTNA